MVRVSLAAAACCAVLSVEGIVRLRGPVPEGITAHALAARYREIHAVVAPGKTMASFPLTILYCGRACDSGARFSLPEWGGGGALGADTIIVRTDLSPFFRRDYFQVTVHEMVHIAIARTCRGAQVPRWFHEGLALTLSGDISIHENLVLSRAVLSGGLLALDTIEKVNAFPEARAHVAYAQSHYAVNFLIAKYGIEVVGEILRHAGETGDFWHGVEKTCGITRKEFENGYTSQLAEQNRFMIFIADTYLFWIAVTLLFIIAFVVGRARKRKRAALMEMEELKEMEGPEKSRETVREQPPRGAERP
jgi:hypothetical protein